MLLLNQVITKILFKDNIGLILLFIKCPAFTKINVHGVFFPIYTEQNKFI